MTQNIFARMKDYGTIRVHESIGVLNSIREVSDDKYSL